MRNGGTSSSAPEKPSGGCNKRSFPAILFYGTIKAVEEINVKKLLAWCLTLLLLMPGAGMSEVEEDMLYPIRDGEKWGYMNKAGEAVIPPQ